MIYLSSTQISDGDEHIVDFKISIDNEKSIMKVYGAVDGEENLFSGTFNSKQDKCIIWLKLI